ncbi:unnamed protein product [Caenorhabditis auriculariae]|uniref:Cation/H+ exchanger transmembrane domain-containing protein n=1 Tax=Caenorhabditis auriculariae TaxID=2777116 RepID=A0A8S1GQD8_9PELO|nr:unnamed protein product [Caenorhabditis auriculariae]
MEQRLHPFQDVTQSALDLENASNDIVHSTMSVFLMVVASLAVGKMFDMIYLPPLLGALLVGIAVRNVPALFSVVYVNDYWEFMLRKITLVNIIIRWGLSVDVNFIRQNLVFSSVLGITSATFEAIVISLLAIFLYDMSPGMAIIAGFLLATVSPAITGPVMAKLRAMKIGCEKKITYFVPAASCFDNIFSIFVFSLTSSLVFTRGLLLPALISTIGAIVLGAMVGLFLGFVMTWFPRNDSSHTQFARIFLLGSVSHGVILSMVVLGYAFPGIVCTLIFCIIAGTKWRNDNQKKIDVVAHSYDVLWKCVSSPILFMLVGYKFNLDNLSWYELKMTLTLVIVGAFVRFFTAMALAACGNFRISEQFVLALSLVPKATVQCALGPSLLLSAQKFPEYAENIKVIIYACVVSVIITAPLVEILLSYLAPKLLRHDVCHTLYLDPSVGYAPAKSIDEAPGDGNVTFTQFRSIYVPQLTSPGTVYPRNGVNGTYR